MFIKQSLIKNKLKAVSQIVFNRIENNGNADFKTNGEKVFIDNLMNAFSQDKKKRIVFDIGANIGEYAQMILDKFVKFELDLHLFEPTKGCFDIVSSKFLEYPNVALNNFGASNKNVKAKIYYDKEQSGLASLYQRNLDSYNIELNQNEEVFLKRLDSYIEEKCIKHIDFIKIDIEGHELKAFEGMGTYLNGDFVDYIQFEYGGANLDLHTSLMEIYNFLNDRGFKIAKMMPNGLELRYNPYMDNFNYANYVAISSRILEL